MLLLPCLFRVRPLVLSKTLSQMWDRLNLPMLLLGVGLLTLMLMYSLIFLAKLCPSLPIIWKLLWQHWYLGKLSHNSPPNRLPQGSSPEGPNPKWVMNLSSKPLTPAQRSVLAKGSNFVVTPKQPPNLEYITAIEAACTKLSQQDAEELRAEVNRVLRSSHPPNPT